MNLIGKKVIITGGNSGIGKATAALLVEKGANVLITGRDEGRLQTVANRLNCKYLCFDISDIDKISENAKKCIDRLGDIDIVINNAGIGKFNLLENISAIEFEQVFKTNVFGLALFTREIVPIFKEKNYGNIINIGSTASLKGFAYGTVYAASKFAVRAMTQCWQAELRKYNIRVSLINPSEVTTAFNKEDRQERPSESKKLTSKEIAKVIVDALELDGRGFIPEVTVWATNPF